MFSRLFGGAGKKTCSERSERNSISEQVYLESVAPAAQRAGAHEVCRQCPALSQVLLQTKDMKKRTEIIRFVFVCFGADNRTCSERSERNSISEQVYLQSVAPAAQRAGANKRSAVCRQNAVLFQVRCRMKKDNPFGLSFFGAVWHNLYEPMLEEIAVLSAVSISFSVFVTCSFVSFRCSGLSVKL